MFSSPLHSSFRSIQPPIRFTEWPLHFPGHFEIVSVQHACCSFKNLTQTSAPTNLAELFFTSKWETFKHFWFTVQKFKTATVFIQIPAHAPINAHQRHFQFKICGTINRPQKSSHPVAFDYMPSPILNTENHQLTICWFSFTHDL